MGLAVMLIAVRLVNADLVPAGTLAEGKRVAGEVLRRAGVTVTWDAGPNSAYSVQMLNRRMEGMHGDTAGYAVIPGRYAVISYPEVVRVADSCEQPAALMLGVAMAHELGHLMQGKAEHAPSGFLSARIGCRELRLAARGELGR